VCSIVLNKVSKDFVNTVYSGVGEVQKMIPSMLLTTKAKMDKTRAMMGSTLFFDFKLMAARMMAGSGHKKLRGGKIHPPHRQSNANTRAMMDTANGHFGFVDILFVIFFIPFIRI
jgi:hypothetical protein